MSYRWWAFPVVLAISGALAGIMLIAFAAAIIYPTLPSLEALTDYQPKIPLRVYSADGKLIAEFGEERRAVVRIEDVPRPMSHAILAAEDERFYQHSGVDYMGVARAALSNFISGGVRQGASTITMQVARNFFLSKERTLTRKFNEVLLAFKIESNLSKDQILELYINQIYLGQRAYGFAAASQTYFGKPLAQLTLAESAMLAGLPKAPSRYNPIANFKRAKLRQQYVLRRMRELQLISEEELAAADRQPIAVRKEINEYPVRAEHFAEMVRQVLYERYQEDTYARGLRVYTTLRTSHQEVAYAALRSTACRAIAFRSAGAFARRTPPSLMARSSSSSSMMRRMYSPDSMIRSSVPLPSSAMGRPGENSPRNWRAASSMSSNGCLRSWLAILRNRSLICFRRLRESCVLMRASTTARSNGLVT